MSSFTTPLIVTPLDDGRKWRLIEGFEYHVGTKDSKEVISIPVGFITDFASVPRLFWNIIPPWGGYGKAAVVHDYLYHEQIYSKSRSDKIFYEAMGILNVPGWKRWVMYQAVSKFGHSAWNQHSKRQGRNHNGTKY